MEAAAGGAGVEGKGEGQQRGGRAEREVVPPPAAFKYCPAALETSVAEVAVEQCISYPE